MKDIDNKYTNFLGIQVNKVSNISAEVSIDAKPHHTNKLGYIHGGLLYSLADAAFELASNAHEEVDAVGINTHMQFHHSIQSGARIEAVARQIHLGRKLATYQVDVISDKKLLASFTGTVYRIDKNTVQ